jgi:hypothetical protein
MDRELALDWLVFLAKHQPHKQMELMHRRNQLTAFSKTARQAAIVRLEKLSREYPDLYIVFRAKQRLLGKQ